MGGLTIAQKALRLAAARKLRNLRAAAYVREFQLVARKFQLVARKF